ncbi:hypothetical protein LINGRAHAP2_LOCUS5832 [Linum grandiflorum]
MTTTSRRRHRRGVGFRRCCRARRLRGSRNRGRLRRRGSWRKRGGCYLWI